MRDEPHIPRRVENYTDAFLGMTAAILFMAFWVLASLAGTASVLVVSAGIYWLISRIGHRRG